MTGDPTQDPRDRALEGLQDARDDSDPGPDDGYCMTCGTYVTLDESGLWLDAFGSSGEGHRPPHVHAPPHFRDPPSWRDRYDTREEWEESR